MKKVLSILVIVLVLVLGLNLVSCGDDVPTTPTTPTTPESPVDPPVNNHEHSYKAYVTAPTCTEQGYTTYICECEDTYVDDYVNANGHDYDTVTTAPTCTNRGYTTYTCACGDIYVDNYLAANGHNFGEWVILKESTYNEEGLEERICDCGEKETKVIGKFSVGLTFSLNSDGVSYSVTGIGTCKDLDIVIPNIYDELPVTGISSSATIECIVTYTSYGIWYFDTCNR